MNCVPFALRAEFVSARSLGFLLVALLFPPPVLIAAVFTDVANQAGLNTFVSPGFETPFPSGINSSTSGYACCAVDIDRDGWTDLIVSQNPLRCLVFMNQRNGTFREEGVERGFADSLDVGGIAAGDLSNRGFTDLVMVPRNSDRYKVYVNDGTGHFAERAAERGADMVVTGQTHRGESVSLVDFDRDGYLDIHVAEWGVNTSPQDDRYSVLLHNKGSANPGFFENVTGSSGLKQPHFGTISEGFAAAWADFDRDGYPDLYLTSDYGTSQMWWNNGNGTFTETRQASRVGTEGNGMGVAVADVNHDGLLDIFVSSFDGLSGTLKSANRLYINEGNRKFHDEGFQRQVLDSSWGWGAAFLDYNNDTNLDLVVTNGYKYYSSFPVSGGDYMIQNANIDRTRFFVGGTLTLTENGTNMGIVDTGIGRAVTVLDFNNDGFEDVLISNAYGPWILYKNDPAGNSNHWLRLKFRGSVSNRDGYGAFVTLTAGGVTQSALYMPTNAYIGQREPFLHFGLGGNTTVTSAAIEWPSGVIQTLTNVTADQILTVVEPVENSNVAPVITTNPVGGSFEYGQEVYLTVAATGSPNPAYTWYKDGVVIPGSYGASYHIKAIHPYDAGNYKVVAKNPEGEATSSTAVLTVFAHLEKHTVARWWNEEILDGIRRDTPNPPVHARNLYHFSAALWDAFWAYEPTAREAVSTVYSRETPPLPSDEPARLAAQSQALSHASFKVISTRYAKSPGAAKTLTDIRWLMHELGYNPDDQGLVGDTPSAVGNRIGAAVLAATLHDGANEANGYADATSYTSVNPSLAPGLPGITIVDPDHWQPLSLSYSITQNGIVQLSGLQKFVGVNARLTEPFALAKPTGETIALDPGPPPGLGSDRVVEDVVDVIRKSSYLDPDDPTTVNLSPGKSLNNPLGTNMGTGHPLNPHTLAPYSDNIVKRGDYARILAEFWADGPNSETPPGHWNVLFNEISDDPLTSHRYAGVGPVLPRLEWDVRGYLALNGSLHDAACAAWTLKRQYDGVRPISLIRYMATLGQSSNPAGPRYNANGLPLIPGLIEQTTLETLAPGQRHAHLVERNSVVADLVGKIVIRAWRGNPLDPASQAGGVNWIFADAWVPYQRNTFVTPAFPGYVSGHSTFSRTAAEVLTLLTGSPYYPGGLSSRTFKKDQFLEFEKGPSADLTLQWATYYDASDEAGLSRLYGGIHPSVDDLTGRRLGSRLGLEGFLKAHGMRYSTTGQGQLVNISARGLCGGDEKALILGFVLDGSAPEDVLVRAVGPTLEAFGIGSDRCAPNPSLSVFGSTDPVVPIVSNEQWDVGPLTEKVVALSSRFGAFTLPAGSADAAGYVNQTAGGYTVVTRPGGSNADKIELVEAYGGHLLNGSARGQVGTGADVLIVGFSVSGSEPAPILVRGTGPTLAVFGVNQVLADPEIRLHRIRGGDTPNEQVGYNDNWRDDAKSSLVESASKRVGAFEISAAEEACLFVQLEPGNYTVTLSGVGGTTGVGLLELYYVK